MKNLLVTGGAGFIGSHPVDRLLLSDVEHVTVLDDFNNFYDPHIKRENITEHLKDPRYKLVDVIEAYHLCMMMRGVQKHNSMTITSALLGSFRNDAKTRDEFLRLAHARSPLRD